MIKILNPSVVKIVGSIASVLLRHLKYWKDSSGKEVVYRTNTQLVEDLEGMFSASQIQRAKKKLIDNGLIQITYGKGYDRTTHYSLTQKALDLLNTPKNDSKHDTGTKDNSGTTVPPKSKTKPYHAKTMPKSNVSQAMKQSFDEQGKPRSNVVKGIPDTLKHLLKGKVSSDSTYGVNTEDRSEDEPTQTEYNECDLAMLHALTNPVEHNDESLTLGSLVGTVFKQAASEDRKKIYQMGQIQYRFSEDY